jgi:hypothetical protein
MRYAFEGNRPSMVTLSFHPKPMRAREAHQGFKKRRSERCFAGNFLDRKKTTTEDKSLQRKEAFGSY